MSAPWLRQQLASMLGLHTVFRMQVSQKRIGLHGIGKQD
jgi:hypothetical protein